VALAMTEGGPLWEVAEGGALGKALGDLIGWRAPDLALLLALALPPCCRCLLVDAARPPPALPSSLLPLRRSASGAVAPVFVGGAGRWGRGCAECEAPPERCDAPERCDDEEDADRVLVAADSSHPADTFTWACLMVVLAAVASSAAVAATDAMLVSDTCWPATSASGGGGDGGSGGGDGSVVGPE